MCIKDPINKTCRKNGKDLSNGAPSIKLWNHTKKTHFPVFAKNFRRPCMKLKIFFCQFPNPWTLRVSGIGGYTSKCEKKSKSLHPNVQHCSCNVHPGSQRTTHYAYSIHAISFNTSKIRYSTLRDSVKRFRKSEYVFRTDFGTKIIWPSEIKIDRI